jgi:glycosyltransferase involved in cell wall biosynthesis
LTVSPKAWAELGAALVVLARDQELRRRMGAFGLQKAGRYAWEEVAAQIVDVYKEARRLREQREAAVDSREVMNVHDAV